MSQHFLPVLYGIITPLPEPQHSEVFRLWEDLEQVCGLRNFWEMPVPHFSWVGMLGFDTEEVRQGLQEIAAQAKPFTARVSSLGIFPGANPVVYLALVKDEPLLRFHEMVWQRLATHLEQPNLYYTPSAWVPHITLAMGEFTPANLGCLIERLAFRTWDWEFLVARIGLISHPPGPVMSFEFGG